MHRDARDVYRHQGRWKEAEELDVQVMETRTGVLGSEHPDMLTSIGNLASTYRNQGQVRRFALTVPHHLTLASPYV